MDKPEEEEYTTKDYSEKKAVQSGDEVHSNVDESAYNREYPRNSHSTDEKESTFDQAAEEQREPIDGSGNSGDDSRVKKYDEKKGSRSKKYDESEEKEDNEKDTDLINSDTAPKLEALSFSKKNVSLDDKYNDSDKASRINDRYYGDKKYSTFKQNEGIITADEDSKSRDNENVAMEIGDLAKNRYPAAKKRSQSTYKQVEDGRKVDAVSGSSDTKKVMNVEDSNKDDDLRTRGKQTLSKGSHDEERPSSEVSKPSVDSEDSIKIEDASKDMSKVSKSADDNEKEMETEEKTVLLSRLRKKKTYDTKDVSGDEKKEKVSESNNGNIESEMKSSLGKLRIKKKTASYAQDVSNESGDDTREVKKDIDSSALVEKNSKSENSNEDATERNELLSNLQIKAEEGIGDVEGETEKGDVSSQDEPNIVLNAEEESTSIKNKKKKRYRDI